MRFFYDTEFLEAGPQHPLELIAVGIVSEDGRELYAASSEFDLARATPWLKEHVLPHLPDSGDPAWRSRSEIAAAIRGFVGDDRPVWWGDYAGYDHVVLSQLFGDMTSLPEGWPMFTHDIQHVRSILGGPELPKFRANHHALADAHAVRQRWLYLRELAQRQVEAWRLPDAVGRSWVNSLLGPALLSSSS